MTDKQDNLATGKLWESYCETLKEAGNLVLAEPAPQDPFNRAEGFRYLSRLSRTALEIFVEHADPKAPVLYRPAHETVKMGADNPDNYYQKAAISGAYEYRISGTRGSVYYLGFGTQASNYGSDGRMGLTGYLESADMAVDADGRFEIIVSCQKQPGNWLPMAPETETLIVRQTFMDRDNEAIADLKIERIGGDSQPEPLSPEAFEKGLVAAGRFVLGTAKLFAGWSAMFRERPNALPEFDQELSLAVGGDPNIWYYHGYWELQDDEVLVIETQVPKCEFWNFQLNNYWMESLDFRYHRIALNNHSGVLEPDGSLKIVVSHRDPGHPNWIETCNHHLGTMCLRWIRANEYPEPQTRVMTLEAFKAE